MVRNGRSACLNFAVIVLPAVLILIAVRRAGRIRIANWQIMAGGTFAIVFSVFMIDHALVVSGVLNVPLVALSLPV